MPEQIVTSGIHPPLGNVLESFRWAGRSASHPQGEQCEDRYDSDSYCLHCVLPSPKRYLPSSPFRIAIHEPIGLDFLKRILDPRREGSRDRKSTRLNSSHRCISYAVFCLKKKKNAPTHRPTPLSLPHCCRTSSRCSPT